MTRFLLAKTPFHKGRLNMQWGIGAKTDHLLYQKFGHVTTFEIAGKQQQISCWGNFNKFNILILFDRISITFAVGGLGFGGAAGG